MKANIKLSLLIISAFLFTFTSYVCAGTFTAVDWIDDTSILLDSSNTYTHAVDFAAAAGTVEINGVTLTQSPGGAVSGTDFVTGNAWTMNALAGHTGTAALPAAGSNSEILKTGFSYNFGGSVEQSIVLEGLQENTKYVFTWYSANWNNVDRIGTLDGDDDGLGAGDTLEVNQNSDGPAQIIQYEYNSGASTSFTMHFTCIDSGNVFHNYAFTNELAGTAVAATKPNPRNGETDVGRDVVLRWKAGVYAVTHNVYVGTDEALVAAADIADANTLAGVTATAGLTDASLNIGRQAYSEVVFWRVDEVNAAPDLTVYPGPVWSFTVEPPGYPIPAELIAVTASSQADADQGPENTINGSGLTDGMHSTDALGSWLSEVGDTGASIQYDFDKAYKVVQMKVWNYNGQLIMSGFGMKDVVVEYSVDDVNWMVLDSVTQLAQATGTEDYAGEIFVIDIVAKSIRITASGNWAGGGFFNQTGLSEIEFLYSPVRATEPDPPSGTTDLDMELTLGWIPGRGVAEHHVYISTDQQLVIDSNLPAIVVTDPTLDLVLSLTNTYYWKVVEVNNANTPPEWPSDVWNFSSLDYYVIDDFEDYNDLDPNDVKSTWSTEEGASIQNVTEVARGTQSMKLEFNNNTPEGYSEARLRYTTRWWSAVDKTQGDPTALVFWVYGDLDNVETEQMYVRFTSSINRSEQSAIFKNVVATSELASPWWTQVTVPLDETAVNFAGIMSINIGLMRSARTSGSGTLYIDDIRLYGTAPIPPVPTNPSTSNLVAYYPLNSNANDASGNGHDGTEAGEPTYGAGKIGGAVQLNGVDQYINCGFNPELTGSFSVSVWANAVTYSQYFGNPMVGTRGEQNEGWAIRRGFRSNNIRFTTNGTGSNNLDSNMLMPLNKWIHVAVVVDLDAMTKSIYINGELDNSAAITAGVTEGPQNMFIGAMSNADGTAPGSGFGGTWLFDGMLDEVRIYDDALTAGEVRFLADPTP